MQALAETRSTGGGVDAGSRRDSLDWGWSRCRLSPRLVRLGVESMQSLATLLRLGVESMPNAAAPSTFFLRPSPFGFGAVLTFRSRNTAFRESHDQVRYIGLARHHRRRLHLLERPRG